MIPQQKTAPNIHLRILAIMSELDYIAKGDKTVNGQYRFVSHDQVTAKLHPLLVKYGITIVPTVEEISQEGNRTVVKMLITFVNAEMPSDNFTVRSVGYGVDGADKGPGKAISYAFKMACLKTFCLETGEDPDNDANARYEPVKCLEFDLILPQPLLLNEKEKAKLQKFLAYSAEAMQIHVEDVKREAVKRPEDFLNKYYNWNPKKEKEYA
jgi:hypothetical protein